MSLWSSHDAAEATGGRSTGDWQASGVSIDTRTLQPGDLFVALKDVRDGHEFVAQALEKGAAAALVNHIPDGVPEDAPLLIVKDVLPALEALGVAARARTGAKVVAVTGSVGKTSTKEMLRDVLSHQGRTHAAEASYNNHWGVPLTLARMPADTEFAVIEIGMSNPGEIAPLSRMARPHVAIVTTVAAAHLEAFENLEGIAHEKASIFEGLEPGGVAIVNGDVETAPILRQKAEARAARVIGFGADDANDHRLLKVSLGDEVTTVQARAGDVPVLYKLGVVGRHFAHNALAVLAAVEAMGGDLAVAASDLGHWVPPGGRGRRETLILDKSDDSLTVDLLDDAFNANPTSMAASLEVLAAATPMEGVGRIDKGRRIAILGDMLELGPDEAAMHAALADLPAMQAVTLVHCVGPRMRHLYEALPEHQRGKWVATAPELADEALRLLDAGDVVLVKGSKGSKVSLVVDALRRACRTKEKDE
ncbi:UDP-N-acetylmuramoyl-tripeptide--D-alanyl-D-alanine ligase [Roseovarius faecimaris]|uniref:UDP-N-acetylmuramoyl-tripeptide--D-alanyl-D-alanine ligase n=1 Tax=Roseovarius faecimaris TaxID=2494550 RepID=A0A6I6IP92_9RHOB|nr:UDP-N-acetylmuramoyl-tripeptide--D-alanyl-D-alanine ligase [Roseovarius faecimaris]QGX97934.1 UDP-N-acetylmuramoyl-tripeptide--D-alanyl-D-alanine ligase [Roseovarius faecimaris]